MENLRVVDDPTKNHVLLGKTDMGGWLDLSDIPWYPIVSPLSCILSHDIPIKSAYISMKSH